MAAVAEAALADAAADDAGQVVSVLVGAITGGLVGGEDVLDLLERLRVDECLVAAWVLDAVAVTIPM
jgi:hypothetical protein